MCVHFFHYYSLFRGNKHVHLLLSDRKGSFSVCKFTTQFQVIIYKSITIELDLEIVVPP